MLVTLPPVTTLVRPEQEQKELSPMLVTPSPIVTLVRPEQKSNAELPMPVTRQPPSLFVIDNAPEYKPLKLVMVACPVPFVV